MGPNNFNNNNYLKLDAKRNQAGYEICGLLYECLPKPILERLPDQTALDALAYELLRRHVMQQALSVHEVPDTLGEKGNRAIADLFGDDRTFEGIRQHLNLLNVCPKKILVLGEIREIVKAKANRIRKEVYGEVINTSAHGILPECCTVPDEVLPARASRFSPALFAYRWCLILNAATGLSWRQALIAHADFSHSVNEFAVNHPRKWRQRYSSIAESFPDLETRGVGVLDTKRGKKTTSKQRDMTVLTRPWALEFMHTDYASLIDWKMFLKGPVGGGKTFIARFIADKLGSHLLKVKLLTSWSWKNEEWQQLLKESKDFPNFDTPETQPVEIKGVVHQYNYLPRHRVPRGQMWKVHVPFEF